MRLSVWILHLLSSALLLLLFYEPVVLAQTNECNTGTDNCDFYPPAECTDTAGSFLCTCPPGWGSTDGGVTCTVIADPTLSSCADAVDQLQEGIDAWTPSDAAGNCMPCQPSLSSHTDQNTEFLTVKKGGEFMIGGNSWWAISQTVELPATEHVLMVKAKEASTGSAKHPRCEFWLGEFKLMTRTLDTTVQTYYAPHTVQGPQGSKQTFKFEIRCYSQIAYGSSTNAFGADFAQVVLAPKVCPPSVSPSTSLSSSSSPSHSPSASRSPSFSASHSTTPSTSASRSPSFSASHSTTRSPSYSSSRSSSPSTSTSRSPSSSPSRSLSFSKSISSSSSPTQFITHTPSATVDWWTGQWSSCNATCGGGISTRVVECRDIVTEANVPDNRCSGTKPLVSQMCNTHPCLSSSLSSSSSPSATPSTTASVAISSSPLTSASLSSSFSFSSSPSTTPAQSNVTLSPSPLVSSTSSPTPNGIACSQRGPTCNSCMTDDYSCLLCTEVVSGKVARRCSDLPLELNETDPDGADTNSEGAGSLLQMTRSEFLVVYNRVCGTDWNVWEISSGSQGKEGAASSSTQELCLDKLLTSGALSSAQPGILSLVFLLAILSNTYALL